MSEAVICPGCGCSVQLANIAHQPEVDETVSAGLRYCRDYFLGCMLCHYAVYRQHLTA